jgi:hypothetical protein
MHLNKPRLELTRSRPISEPTCGDLQTSQGRHPHFSHLIRLGGMGEQSSQVSGACAHAEIRHAQKDAQHTKETALSSAMQIRQLAR